MPAPTSSVPPVRLKMRIAFGLLHHIAGARRDQRVAEGIGEGEREERRLEDQHLRPEIGVAVEELRQEGDEEGDALRVERRHQPGMRHHLRRGRRVGPRLGVERAAGAEQLYAEIDQIGRADPFQRGEHGGGRREQRADAEHRQRHGGEVAERDADRHRQRGAPALAERIGHDEQDGRPRNDQEDGGSGDEGKPGFEGHVRVSSLKGEDKSPARGVCKAAEFIHGPSAHHGPIQILLRDLLEPAPRRNSRHGRHGRC